MPLSNTSSLTVMSVHCYTNVRALAVFLFVKFEEYEVCTATRYRMLWEGLWTGPWLKCDKVAEKAPSSIMG